MLLESHINLLRALKIQIFMTLYITRELTISHPMIILFCGNSKTITYGPILTKSRKYANYFIVKMYKFM